MSNQVTLRNVFKELISVCVVIQCCWHLLRKTDKTGFSYLWKPPTCCVLSSQEVTCHQTLLCRWSHLHPSRQWTACLWPLPPRNAVIAPTVLQRWTCSPTRGLLRPATSRKSTFRGSPPSQVVAAFPFLTIYLSFPCYECCVFFYISVYISFILFRLRSFLMLLLFHKFQRNN